MIPPRGHSLSCVSEFFKVGVISPNQNREYLDISHRIGPDYTFCVIVKFQCLTDFLEAVDLLSCLVPAPYILNIYLPYLGHMKTLITLRINFY